MNEEVKTTEEDFSSAPPQYTEEEKAAFLKSIMDYQKTHPLMRSGQKKFRSRMTNLIPKKKKRKK